MANVSNFPTGVLSTIRHALVFNLREYHQRFGEDLPDSDLYVDIVKAVKWVHETDPQTAVSLVWHAFQEATVDDGPTLEDAARCLRLSLTQSSEPYGRWTPEEADGFVAAALIMR
ncbi:hypothetical protein ACIQPP_19580 [Streptomyces violaceusniger]|uniref:hypothetical protein n=1 Tax=Streptomyces violaceusniger TaxID=68280 RepID=UPI0009C2E11F|nr:hypothetical protein [Streptomyces hygroscopicus]AQW50725.1 hypothetical protein SHXM_04188 [Streptomyces hygroscopicus]